LIVARIYGIKLASKEKINMPKTCDICGKGPAFGHSVSHSHKASPKKWKPNLQQVKAQTAKGARMIWVCTRCLRSGKVAKAV
jgi:large subunit ribosomal protein L28